MNTRYKQNPEVIATVRSVNDNGNDLALGDKIVGIQVVHDKSNENGLLQIDVRNMIGKTNYIIEIELPEIVAALSFATLNCDHSD